MRILIVDDEERILSLVQDYLELEGYAETVVALSGQEALRQIRARKPDLLIMDNVMPGMKGIEVLEEMRRDPEMSELPVILFSTVDSPSRSERERMHFEFMQKPIRLAELKAMIASLLKRPKQSE